MTAAGSTGTASSPGPAPAGPPAYRDGNVLRWLAAFIATMIGEGVYFLALAWAALETGGPAQVGLIMMVGALPRAVLMLGGGVLADRFGPRPVVIGSDAVRCAVILGVAAALHLSAPGLWLLLTVALVFGAVDALFMPAIGALTPRIAPASQLARIQGMRSLGMRLGNTAGPPVGGAAMALGGLEAAFAVAGLLFALSLPFLLSLRVSPLPAPHTGAQEAEPTAGSAWADLRAGLRYLGRHRLLRPLVLTGVLVELALAGPLNVGLVLLADERGWGAAGMAWVISAFGLGAAASALLLTARGRLPRAGALVLASIAVAAVALTAVGLLPSVPAAAAAAGTAGLAAGLCGGLALALTQTSADPRYLGRVMSVLALGNIGLAPLTFPMVGAAIGLWGTAPVYLAAGLLGLAAAAVGSASAELRRAELPG
ncbi:MFS transporter [Streptomyces sp. ACA25]|uniref:MFS transporter n=1 Tax=Streptomyces sp. ACA25 TaxID=3022596 RepID=UPI002306EEBB|nr:MFS transporter [Streptomyces sp. ACA25]MDB1088627.1 MFS transporter [Streptomyces sp. ACA25]